MRFGRKLRWLCPVKGVSVRAVAVTRLLVLRAAVDLLERQLFLRWVRRLDDAAAGLPFAGSPIDKHGAAREYTGSRRARSCLPPCRLNSREIADMNARSCWALLAAIVWLGWTLSAPAAEGQPTPAEPEPAAIAVPVAKAAATAVPTAGLAATVRLNAGINELRGTLTSHTELTMKTSFGEVNIPLSEVAGIKLASAGNASTTVVMHSGDSVTGAWNVNRIELRTEWGTAMIDGTAINSILLAPGMVWVSEKGLSGARWQLMAKPQTAETEKPAETATSSAHEFKPGDIIVIARDMPLQIGGQVVGKVSKGNVLGVEKVQDTWVSVNNGKEIGWIPKIGRAHV